MTNRIETGNNYDHLRVMDSDSVDLIYLDPPYNSGRNYNITVDDSMAQEVAYSDTWNWDEASKKTFRDMQNLYTHNSAKNVVDFLLAIEMSLVTGGFSSTFAYLVMLSPRLIELRRVLKPNGTLYLHCDTTAGDYLKVVLDQVFGPRCFRADISWKRTFSHGNAKCAAPVHDRIFHYTKGSAYTWNPPYHALTEDYIAGFTNSDPDGRVWKGVLLTGPGTRSGSSGKPWRGYDPTEGGRHWSISRASAEEYKLRTGEILEGTSQERLEKLYEQNLIVLGSTDGGAPQYKQYLDKRKGVPLQDIWVDIPRVTSGSKENVEFEGQKPVALLTRIIECSSNPGDLVLDPFFGSGTTGVAAHRLRRRFHGIELTPKTCEVAKKRLRDEFGEDCWTETNNFPADLESAKALAKTDKYAFQCWVVHTLGGTPNGRGADKGIDGFLTLNLYSGSQSKLAIIQVKGGEDTVKADEIRAFTFTLAKQGERAALGLFVSFRGTITKGMREDAATLGYFKSEDPRDHQEYPRIQFISVEDLFNPKMRFGGALLPGYVEKMDRVKRVQTRHEGKRSERENFNLMMSLCETEDD